SRLVRGAIVVVLAASTRRTRATCGSHEGWWSVFRAPRTCTCLNSSGVRTSLIASHSPPRGARCRSAFGRQDRRCRRAVLQISEVYGMDQVGVMFEQALHESGRYYDASTRNRRWTEQAHGIDRRSMALGPPGGTPCGRVRENA